MNGLLLIDKQPDWTSNDVVAKMRGVLRERRVGHAGTLDPMATGLLVVLVGRATRASQYAEAQRKHYLARLRLGLTTDTQDIWGRTVRERPADISEDRLREVLRSFTGEIAQVPPMYSAIKVNGRKLYDIARRSGEIERQPRPITVHAIELLGREDGDWVLDIRCSKGTYVRTLCHDIGEALGCGGCMSALRRLEVGAFSVDNARTVAEVEAAEDREALLIPTDRLFADRPRLTVKGAAEQKLRCGNALRSDTAPGEYRVYAENGDFLALCRVEDGRLLTVKSFFEVETCRK